MLGAAFSRLPPSFPNGLQVLLLAPEPATRTEISGQLAELAYKVDAFAAAREAAAFLSRDQNAAKLDIVLAEASSVHVGDTDSEWLLRQAKAAHLPLVLMSGSGSQGEVMKGIELGAVDYLEKPISSQKLRNIWQHVVRKMMLNGGVPEDQKPSCSMKVEAPMILPPTKAVATASGPSPAASGDQPVHSTHTGHSSKCSEAEASSCSEMTKLRRCLRSADTSAESSGKQQPATSGETAAGSLSRATSTSAPRTRPKRTLRETKRQPSAANIAASDPPAILPVPSAAWQTVPGCGWGSPTVPMSWQMPGMPGTFMPVSSSPLAAVSGATDTSGSPKKRKGSPAASEAPPATLPSMGSFASCMSCTLEMDLDLNALGCAPADLASPSFAASDDSLSSDFTELMLPDDLDLDAMFGDGLDAPMGADCCGLPPLAADKPPIGLSLRKSQSFVNLINATLAASTSSSVGASMPCGA